MSAADLSAHHVDALLDDPEKPAAVEPGRHPRLDMRQALAALRPADRAAWTDHPPLNLPVHPAETYLRGWVIALDPGHGGRGLDDPTWKAGPTGVREAVINLRVALLLRELLTQAGATVALTREGEFSGTADDRIGEGTDAADPRGTLQRRADFANNLPRPDGGTGADLLVSIHHNASPSPTTNFTSVWFHGPPKPGGGLPFDHPWEVSLDAARHLATHVAGELRPVETGKTSPLMSDRQMYDGGFGILRHARVPAVLVEASFFSHPAEEQRLDDPGYLLREAYGLYRGLCELAYAGRPTQRPPTLEDRTGPAERAAGTTLLRLRFRLDDGLPDWWGSDLPRTLPSTLEVRVAGQRVAHVHDPATNTVTADLRVRRLGTAPFDVAIHHQNLFKSSNFPRRYTMTWDPSTATSRATPR